MYSKAKWLFFIINYIVWTNLALAQNITKSPYSVIGAGDLVFAGNTANFSMGQVTQGIRKPFEINWLNPASYSGLTQTNIETGATFAAGSIKSVSQSSSVNNAWLAYINMAMPLSTKKGIGFSFGLSPYTSVGYNVSSLTTLPSDSAPVTAINNFEGRGGLSKAYGGFGARLTKNLSAGVNLNFVFGQVNSKTQLLIPVQYNMFNTEEDRNSYISGLMLDFGLQYHKTIQKDYELVVGSTITPNTTLSGTQSYIYRTLPLGQTVGAKDTIINNQGVKGNVNMPLSWQAGFSFSKLNNWLIAADVNGANWSNYKAFNRTDSLQNSIGFNLGGSYIPNYAATKNIFNKLEYRAGFRFSKTNWQFYNQSINAMAFSAGVGIPLVKSKSKVSVGFEYSTRGTTSNNLIQEDYFRVIIGVSFSDKWFYRYRYD